MCELADLPIASAKDSLLAMLMRGSADDRERTTACLVEMLSSPNNAIRQKGYALFREALEDALFQSCLNYGALVHGFTHPLLCVLEQAIESWAKSSASDRAIADPGDFRTGLR